jgi:DNA-directed RNA polymerase subunit L
MKINIINDEKENLLFELDNQTVAELLKVELSKNEDIELAAWKKEHPEKPVLFEVKTSGKYAKKEVLEALSKIDKDLDKLLEDFKKAIK